MSRRAVVEERPDPLEDVKPSMAFCEKCQNKDSRITRESFNRVLRCLFVVAEHIGVIKEQNGKEWTEVVNKLNDYVFKQMRMKLTDAVRTARMIEKEKKNRI